MRLEIVDWNEHFENNRTRDMKFMSWVPIPNKQDGDGYTELVTGHENGTAHFGVWVALVEIASKCQPRGVLVRSTGKGHSFETLSRISRMPQNLIEQAVARLIEIGWLRDRDAPSKPNEMIIPQEGAEIPQEGAEIPQEGAVLPRALARVCGTERNGTERNGTELPPTPLQGAKTDSSPSKPSKKNSIPQWCLDCAATWNVWRKDHCLNACSTTAASGTGVRNLLALTKENPAWTTEILARCATRYLSTVTDPAYVCAFANFWGKQRRFEAFLSDDWRAPTRGKDDDRADLFVTRPRGERSNGVTMFDADGNEYQSGATTDES